MKSSAIQLHLDLGRNQHLFDNLRNAFAAVVEAEPSARKIIMLLLLQMYMETESVPVEPVSTTNDAQGELLPELETRRALLLQSERKLQAPAIMPKDCPNACNCKAFLREGVVYCDACARRWPPLP